MSGAGRPGRRRSGGTGRRAGLKIPCPQGHEGSSPSSGTTPFPVAWCTTGGGRTGEDRRAISEPRTRLTKPRPLGSPSSNSGRGEKRDARERGRSEPRRKGRMPWRGEGSGGRPPPPALTHRMRTGEDRRAISEPRTRLTKPRPLGSPSSNFGRGEERDARERGRSEPRRKGRRHGGAAPLPNGLRSLGYPATNRPGGKAQAGDPLLRHHLKTHSSTCLGAGRRGCFRSTVK